MMREYRAAQCSRQKQATIRRLVCDVKAATTADRIGMLVALAEQELGGAQALAIEWVSHFRSIRGHRGGRRVMDFFAATMRLSAACTELRSKTDFGELSDEELQGELNRLVAAHVRECLPAMTQRLMLEGWSFAPPRGWETTDKPTEPAPMVDSLV